MKNLTIRTRILASFGIILLIMAALGFYAYYGLVGIAGHAATVESVAIAGLHDSTAIKDALAADHRAVRSRMFANDQDSGDRLAQAMAARRGELDRLIAAYRQRIAFDRERALFAQFEEGYVAYRTATGPGFRGEARGAAASLAFASQFDDATREISEVSAFNQDQATSMLHEINAEISALLTAVVLCFLIAFALALAFAYSLFRTITRPLARLTALMDMVRQGDFTQRMEIYREDELGELSHGFNRMADEVMELVGHVQRSGIRVSTSMTEIAATSKQQQATASEVAATTTEIGATSQEIAATSRELVRTMNEVATGTDNTARLALSGQSALASMEDSMAQVMDAASSINTKLTVLNEKAGDINQVVVTITKVADQTNLLSLNAAIEAEKAGEFGRGFTVVSTEIRRLADQTAVATYDIEQMVKEIQAAVSAGVMGMDRFSEEVRRGLRDVHEIGTKLTEIIGQVQDLVPRFESVTEGMQAQATGAEQISEALIQLTDATQQTVESLRQSGDAINELNQVSGSLHGSIARFKLATN